MAMGLKFFTVSDSKRDSTPEAREFDLGISSVPVDKEQAKRTAAEVTKIFQVSITSGSGAALKADIERALQQAAEARKSAKRDGPVSVEG
ncbi:hypothetical protein OKW30_001193 [Paraburkholderia sp. Clong3]|uniref:hypothetical protein n=1 Tax=Paraburkholderia sp. Clong3 TaxID=2991061 RepID=UPI003D1D6165